MNPHAIGLAQTDAGSLELKVWLASHATRRVKVVVTYILDEEAIFWRRQCWTIYHWRKKRREKRKKRKKKKNEEGNEEEEEGE
ncbi:hypothetical protein EYF80_017789 [Liparis tanakae]|uniref:Uncharacterized protein n=1 Tax=Liparis tanakae TaxID=230148 RepID=A0A4Z2I2K1_9TELE|nr:hypothetical protein EYF80_017789 [Liparis tanakae]